MTQEERRRRLVAMGLDPTKYRYVTNTEKAARNLTQGSAFTTGVGSAIGPALGGIAGGAVPLALASGPVGWGALGLSVLGGLAGGYLGGKAQEGLEGAAYDDETLRELQLRRQAAYEKYPKTTFAGQVAPSLLAFRPSLTTLKSLPGAVVNAPLRTQTALQRYALTSAGVGGGLEAGVEAGSQALRGEDIDLGRIAMAGALGATLTEPTRMYGRLGATIGRTGQSGKDFLEARGMTRPLADDDPRLLEELQVARETVEKERTQQRREKERLKETAEQSAQKDSKPTPEQKKPTTPHEDEIISRQLDEDIKNAEAEKEKAEAADIEAVKKNPPKGLRPTQVEHRAAVERLTNLHNQRARVAGETREQSTRADDLWNKHQRRQAGISGKDPLPPPKDLLKAAKGFAARQGMRWEEKVIDMAKRASDDQYRGIYDVHTHTAQLSTLAKEDTPWHEYLHGIWQVLKRSGDHKHRQLIKIFEDDLLKKDGVPLSAEESIVELGGRALERRMNDVSKDGKIARWFKDWRLERDARKGFPKKEGEKNDEYLGRLADWLAMRGERAPAMQPKQLKAFLRDLPVRHANDGFDSVEGGVTYAKDAGAHLDEQAAKEIADQSANLEKELTDPIDRLKAKIVDGKKITVSHVGAEDLSGTSQDALRKTTVESNLRNVLGLKLNLDQKTINLTKGQNFLEGAGHGSDIVVLHRIPNERTAQTGEQFTGPVTKDHTLENWQKAVSDSNAELVYVIAYRDAGDFSGLDFFQMPGYKALGDVVQEPQDGLFLTVLKKEPPTADSDVRHQYVKPEVALADEISRRSIDFVDGEFRLPTGDPVTRAATLSLIKRAEDSITEPHAIVDTHTSGKKYTIHETLAELRALPDDADVTEVRRWLVNDSRDKTKQEAIRRLESRIRDNRQYTEDLRRVLEVLDPKRRNWLDDVERTMHGERRRFQAVEPEELNDALKIASLHDASSQYSKRVRSKMMERIKAGTYSVAQGQKVLARFASKPFPSDMSGEEIAQVINGLEMYHGSGDAESVLREGFRGEKLVPTALMSRGIYMTSAESVGVGYAGQPTTKHRYPAPGISEKYTTKPAVIPIRTNFKNLLDMDKTLTLEESKKFVASYIKNADKLDVPLDASVLAEIKSKLRGKSFRKLAHKIQLAPTVYNRLRDAITEAFPESSQSAAGRKGMWPRINEASDSIRHDMRVKRGERGINNEIDLHNRIIQGMGYDGLTYQGGMRAGLDDTAPHRVVMAFREPFQQATNQLHEYYGGERLQSVDDILKDTNDYQISSATDHFSSNPIIKNAWFVDSVVDKIRAHGKNDEERKISNMVADALDAAARDANRLEGEFGEGFLFAELSNVNLNREDARHVARYMVLTRRGRADEIPADTLARYNEPDSPVRHYVDYFKKQYKEVRDRQIAAGMKITDKDGKAREPGQDEDYYPELLNQEMRRELTGEKGASLRQQREDELVNWWLENAAENQEGEPLFTEKDARQAASAYIEKLTGHSNHIGSTHFAALRKAEGIGLPTTLDADGNFLWIDNSAANTYTRYMRRFARDFAFYTNVENNPTVAMVLGIKNQDGKRPGLTPELQKINPFYLAVKDDETGGGWRAKSATKDANIQDYIKGYLGYYDGQELVGRTANRLIVSHWLGLMSGVRDIMSSFVHALPYMRLSDAPAIAGAIRDFGKSWTKSHLTGVNRSQYNRLEFATETSNRLADSINRWADLMTVVTGRNLLERSARAFQFSLGRMVAMRQLQAEAGDVTANRTLARLQQMSGVDTKGLRGKMASEEQLDRLAAAWVEINQGTYDVRGVPNWTLYGPASMFTSLGRWNIEKFNRMRKDVMDPAIDDGDFRPLIKATLGTVITGTLLVEMAELINNKFNSNPTLLESAKEGNTEEAAYAVADLMNQVGYFGIMSALINDTAIQFSRGERIRSGGVVFPAYDFFANALSEPLFDANDAVKEGADFWPTYTRAITDVLKNTTQTYRIVWNQTFGREETEKKNIRRDLRIFRRFEGERAATQPRGVGNPYLRPDTREFKESDTLGKAVETLPAAFEEQRERAAGRGDKLKEYTSGLYTIPEKGMPAIATTEGVDEFLRYRDYIMRQRGSGRWDRMFEDWARRKQLTATKKALVKSYVAHLMQTQRAR